MITKTPEETIDLGKRIGALLETGVVLLSGDLGAGKTTLTKGIALARGVDDIVKSPTFIIMKEYQTKKQPMYHFDFYRLEQESEDFDLIDYFSDETLSIVEWPEQAMNILPKEYLLIEIMYISPKIREFKFVSVGEKYEKVVSML